MATYTESGSNGYTLKLTLTESNIDITGNKSDVNYSLDLTAPSSAHFSQITTSWYVKLNGSSQVNTSAQKSISAGSSITLASGTTTIAHDSNGQKTITVEFGAKQTVSYGIGDIKYSGGTFALTTINRKATMTSASDFNDEQNVTFNFVNNGGYVTEPYLNFYNTDGTTVGLSITRFNGKVESGYVLAFTEAERTAIRNYLNNRNSCTVTIGIRTTISGDYYWDSIAKTCTIVNANPSFNSVTYADVNTSVVAITQNNQKIVQNKSSLQVNFASATARKGATITNYEFTLNGVKKTATSSGSVTFGTVNSANNLTLQCKVTDSRGNTATATREITMLEYQNPYATVILGRVNNYEDNTFLKVSGTIASVDEKNQLTIQYKYKELGGTYNELTEINNNEQIDLVCDKNKQFTFYVIVSDLFGGSFIAEYTLAKGKFPLFIDTVRNAVGVNDFVDDGEAFRVVGGVANMIDGLQINGENVNDFVIERGTSSGWNYEKTVGGTLRQWKNVNANFSTWSEWGNSYWYNSNENNVTFGVSFVSPPIVNATNQASTWAIPMIQSITNNGFSLYGIRPNSYSTANAFYFSIYAVGRWK